LWEKLPRKKICNLFEQEKKDRKKREKKKETYPVSLIPQSLWCFRGAELMK
jgi:hypothetical protein